MKDERNRSFLFTLIELLVVIAIIAILMAILLPSLKQAKNTTNTIVCVSNLRQVSVAFSNYITDNNELIPDHNELAKDGITSFAHAGLRDGNYIKPENLICPTVYTLYTRHSKGLNPYCKVVGNDGTGWTGDIANFWINPGSNQYFGTYNYFGGACENTFSAASFRAWASYNQGWQANPNDRRFTMRLQNIKNAAGYAMVWDMDWYRYRDVDDLSIGERIERSPHSQGKGHSFMYLDGHAKFAKVNVWRANWYENIWDETPVMTDAYRVAYKGNFYNAYTAPYPSDNGELGSIIKWPELR